MSKNKFISALNLLGQSIWYDNLSRDVLASGELATLIEQGVSGLTSNPTIFQKAISESDKYDDDIKKLLGSSPSDEQICEKLMVQDVVSAADLLLPVYSSTQGKDGFASLEVSPTLAEDTEGTIEEANRLWRAVDRPNCMIKVPATPAGIPAIERLLYSGINVNITLIFSVETYQKVAEAYIKALELRMSEGKTINSIASVASFFVSRVDSICEKTFDGLFSEGRVKEADRVNVWGKVGIANSKLAYFLFENLFYKNPIFSKLKDNGASVQRPLWASTGTKNSEFSPVLYVEELVGKDTVNTLPPKTLAVLMKGATIEPRLHSGLKDAKHCLKSLADINIDLNTLLNQLQRDGVKAFADSYQQLLQAISDKRVKLAA